MRKRNNKSPSASIPMASGTSAFASLQSLRGKLPGGVTPDPPPQDNAPRFASKVVVSRERVGRGGKTVTIVQGILLRGEERDELLRRLRKNLGTAGHVEDERLVLGGDLVERAARWLEAEGASQVIRAN